MIKNMKEKIELKLLFPDYKELKVILPSFSANVYNILNKKKVKEIDRYKKMNHLGLLSEIYETTHNSKWEYIFLQLYLFDLFKEKGQSFGMGSNIKLNEDKSISTLELLQAWALFLNIGHLYRTFEAERVWFNEILSSKRTQDFISSSLPRKIFKDKFSNILEKEDYMGFYGIISVLYLNIKLRSRANDDEIEELLDILELWFKPEKLSTRRAKKIYKTIRFISHVYLDSNYSHSFLKVHNSQFFDYIEKNASQILHDKDNDLIQAFKSINEYLFLYLYCSEKAATINLNYNIERSSEIKKAYRIKRNQKGKESIKNKFISRLIQARIHDLRDRLDDNKWKHFCRFHLIPEYPFMRDECKYYTEEKKLNGKKPKNIYYMIQPLKSKDFEGSLLDVFYGENVDKKTYAKVIFQVKNYILEVFKIHYGDQELYDIVTQKTINELFEFCLKGFIGKQYKFRFLDGSPYSDINLTLIKGKSTYKNSIKNIKEELKDSKFKKERLKEIENTLKLIFGTNKLKLEGSILLALAPVQIYDKQWKCIAEFDGLLFNIFSNKVNMILCETKTGTYTSNDALKQINEKIEKLNLSSFRFKKRTRKRKEKYAYAILSLK